MPPDSNIVRFQREFYLYPHPGSPDFLWSYVFGEKYKDVAAAPRDTALRSAVLDWLEAGNELFDLPGVMLHGPDQWGTQPYYPKEIQHEQPDPIRAGVTGSAGGTGSAGDPDYDPILDDDED
jgi:hypothetical protein